MGYPAKAIANFFLDVASRNKTEITPLKMQKLVYVSHGWHLALTDGNPLINDEYAEAWQYGPVFPSLYHEFKRYGGNAIADYASDVVLNKNGDDFETSTPRVWENDVYVHDLLNKIWEVYSGFSGSQLSSMTHANNTPWEQTWHNNKGMRNAHIPNESISEYYQDLMKKNNGD